jgi:hypothetical protein
MDHIVRRVKDGALSSVSGDDALAEPVTRRDHELSVTSQRILGVQPRVLLAWSASAECWRDGYKLLVFRSPTGFAPDRDTRVLSEHGPLILEETADGDLEEHLPEGTHFYTFILHRRKFLGLGESFCVVRFSETIPSAKTAVGRIEDQVKLARMKSRHEADLILDQVAHNEAMLKLHHSNRQLKGVTEPKPELDPLEEAVRREVEPIVRQALVRARKRVEMAVQLAKLTKELKGYPGWKALKPSQRHRVLADIAADLDADEATFEP